MQRYLPRRSEQVIISSGHVAALSRSEQYRPPAHHDSFAASTGSPRAALLRLHHPNVTDARVSMLVLERSTQRSQASGSVSVLT